MAPKAKAKAAAAAVREALSGQSRSAGPRSDMVGTWLDSLLLGRLRPSAPDEIAAARATQPGESLASSPVTAAAAEAAGAQRDRSRSPRRGLRRSPRQQLAAVPPPEDRGPPPASRLQQLAAGPPPEDREALVQQAGQAIQAVWNACGRDRVYSSGRHLGGYRYLEDRHLLPIRTHIGSLGISWKPFQGRAFRLSDGNEDFLEIDTTFNGDETEIEEIGPADPRESI